MLTKEQKKWIEHLSDVDKIKIVPYNPKVKIVFGKIKKDIQQVLGKVKVVHRGSTSLKIAGQGEIDLYIPIVDNKFNKYLKKLIKHFGKVGTVYPLERARFVKYIDGIKIEIFLINNKSKGWKEGLIFEDYLKNNSEELKKYEILKIKHDGLSTRKYYKPKIVFLNKILAMAKKEKQTKKTYVISLGGSLIVPDQVDYKFIKKFRELIIKKVKAGSKFIIVCGGGGLNRKYNEAGKKVRKLNNEELDWIGIYATRYNAQFVKILFGGLAHNEIITDPHKKIITKKSIIIGSGYKPGWSTDYDAVYLAKTYGVKSVANLSNIDYAYDKDPKKYKNAVPIKNISWKDFRKIVGNKWEPRMNKPFDPIASREAEKLGLEVVILNGKKLKNFEDYLNGGKFVGTVIKQF
ncbi:UMP kinase [Candidatus Parcubacteria bacterium]|nr:UMP kinase [Candidatus Parcubacteria bacterium]